jgi:AcrR family transcriptional regulator
VGSANSLTVDDLGSAAQRDRRKRILDATIALASQGGFDAVQMRAVAERADVALGTLYRYFPSKIHLLVSALEREFERAEADTRDKPIPGATAHERVMFLLDRTTQGLQRDPHLTEALTRAFMFADASVKTEILAVGVLVTGSIWARAAWGHWWVWDEPTLVSFLIVFLLYACYQPLRFSIEDPERQARYAAVFSIVGGAFVPLNFMAVRAAESLTHPRVLSTTGGAMPGSMRLTFLVALAGMAVLFVTLNKYELTSKSASFSLRALRRRLAEDDDGWVPVRRSAAPQL